MTYCPHCSMPIRYLTDSHTIFTVDTEERTLITERGRKVTGFMLHSCVHNKDGTAAAGTQTAVNSLPDDRSEV